MMASRLTTLTAGAALLFAACGGEQPPADETVRDLSLAPAESVATLSDAPPTTPAQPQPQPRTQTPAARPQQTAPRTVAPTAAPAGPTSTALSLKEGAMLMLAAGDTLTSRHNKKGETVVATAAANITDERGRVVIPAGAVFTGVISDIAPAESPGGEGRMVLTFNRVEFGGNSYAVAARTDSIGTYMKGRGVTAGDAAKVGAGTVIGAVAGRVIGGNKTGTIVGAAAGTAAGVGIAAATRDIDIILAAGAPIRLVLTAPLTVQ